MESYQIWWWQHCHTFLLPSGLAYDWSEDTAQCPARGKPVASSDYTMWNQKWKYATTHSMWWRLQTWLVTGTNIKQPNASSIQKRLVRMQELHRDRAFLQALLPGTRPCFARPPASQQPSHRMPLRRNGSSQCQRLYEIDSPQTMFLSWLHIVNRIQALICNMNWKSFLHIMWLTNIWYWEAPRCHIDEAAISDYTAPLLTPLFIVGRLVQNTKDMNIHFANEYLNIQDVYKFLRVQRFA